MHSSCLRLPPVVRMTMLCSLLLLSTLARQIEYSFKMFRLRYLSTLLNSIGPVVKSLLDIPVKVCVANKYIHYGLLNFFHDRYFSFLAFERSDASIFFCPQALSFAPTLPLHQKSWRHPRSGGRIRYDGGLWNPPRNALSKLKQRICYDSVGQLYLQRAVRVC